MIPFSDKKVSVQNATNLVLSIDTRMRGYFPSTDTLIHFWQGFEANRPISYYGPFEKVLKDMDIPKDLSKFYPSFEFRVLGRRGVNAPSVFLTAIVPCSTLEKYCITPERADQIIELFRSRVPSSFANLNEETASRFVQILNKDRGFNLATIIFFPTAFTLPEGCPSWGEYYHSSQFIVMDNFMNPIDVDELEKTINDIVKD